MILLIRLPILAQSPLVHELPGYVVVLIFLSSVPPILVVGAITLKLACSRYGVLKPKFLPALGIFLLASLAGGLTSVVAGLFFLLVTEFVGQSVQQNLVFINVAIVGVSSVTIILLYKLLLQDCTFGKATLIWFYQGVLFAFVGTIIYLLTILIMFAMGQVGVS